MITWPDSPSSPASVPALPVSITDRGRRAVRAGAVILLILVVVAAFVFFNAPSLLPGQLEAVGKAYPHRLGVVYAAAWEDGAKLLDAGQPIQTALGQVKTTWDSRRVQEFESIVTPYFSRVVPEGKAEKDVTAEDRQRLAKAWREFARGLEK